MLPQNVVFPAGATQGADVGTQQAANLVRLSYSSNARSGMVSAGRPKSAEVNKSGCAAIMVSSEPQKGWSRGCRRAESFWSWLWLQPWLLAPRKNKSPSSNRSPSSRPTPASTSDLSGRARQPRLCRPDPDFRLSDAGFALSAGLSPTESAGCLRVLWATEAASPIRPSCMSDRSTDRC